jgi:hypothetical protein
MKSKFLDCVLVMVLLVTVVSGFGHTWEHTNTLKNYLAIGMSADGRIICAVDSGDRLDISTNWGKTWITMPNSHAIGGIAPNGIAVSADGAIIHGISLSSSSWVSTNQGITWAQTAFPFNVAWRIACSGDGAKVIAASINGPVCYSTNSGANCYASSAPNAKWVSLASTADGKRMVAAVDGGDIYFSTNYGASWTPTGLFSQAFTAACVSANGQWIGATTATNSYLSSDAGVSWVTNGLGGGSIACTANGSNWVIAASQLYTSTDGGVTWQTNLPITSASMAVVSADGCEISVLQSDGIWMGRATASPQLNIQPKDSNLDLSWLLPSTNFVLQQNADLTIANWITVSNGPTLNFTNLQQEVRLPATTNSMFFRLIAQ